MLRNTGKAHWMVVVAAVIGAGVGLLAAPAPAPAAGARACGMGAAIDASDPESTPYMRLKVDVASSESADANWSIRIDAVPPGGTPELGAALANGDWQLPGWSGLKLASTGLDITFDAPGTLYTATVTITDINGATNDTSSLTYTKP